MNIWAVRLCKQSSDPSILCQKQIAKSMLNKILDDKRVRYILTGGTSFVAEYGSFLALVYIATASAWLSQAISYCIGLVVNFLLLKYWAFYGQNKDKARTHILKFGLLVAFNLPATTITMDLLIRAGVVPFLAKVAVVALATLWNYIIYDKLIFKDHFSPEDMV